MRLAINTGMEEELKEYTDSGKHKPLTDAPSEARAIVGEIRRGPGWSDTDKIIFAAGVAGATIVGAIIIFA
jgi:hypothetical protein